MFPSVTEKMVDPFAVEAAANYPYDVPNVHVDFQQQEIGIDVGYWRSVSHALNCYVAESFMDELAVAAKKGSYEFRKALLQKQPRFLRVLDLAFKESHFNARSRGTTTDSRSWRVTAPTWRRSLTSRSKTARSKCIASTASRTAVSR
jgi:isoquinoline 1-oxidoreductase beta subunit